MKSPIILRIFRDDKLLEVKQFEQDQVIFGQESDAQIRLDDEQVAPIHCLIERRDSGYYVCDLGSVSGTFKNGNQVLDEAISSGDQIKIGPFVIHFFVGVPKPKVPPATEVAGLAAAVPPVVTPPPPAAKATPRPVVPPPPKLPEVTKTEEITLRVPAAAMKSTGGHKKRGRKTFAPASTVDLKKTLKPGKGPNVEVIVAWKERVLATYMFETGARANIGPEGPGNITVPNGIVSGSVPFLEISGGARVTIPAAAQAELIGKAQGISGSVNVEQGELLCVSFENGLVQIFVRYAVPAPRPLPAPLFDFTSGELTGIVVTLVMVALTALYMSVYTPPLSEEKKEDKLDLVAKFIYNKPKPTPEPVPVEKVKVAETPPVATPTPPPEKKVVKVTDIKQEQKKVGKTTSTAASTERPATKAAEVRPIPSKVDRPKKFTSAVKQGGAVKTGKTEGANMQSAKDVTKTGLMAAFGGGGSRSKLDQAYSGAGDVIGMGNQATGSAGSNQDRAGDDLGNKFKDTGAGGKGTATSGISGVGTKGRASGQSAYGGLGFGGKGSVAIDAGGSDAEFVGTIDKEAVRRVVRSKLSEIKNCYERALNVDKSLEGKVVIRFLIEDQGRVRIATTKSTSLNNRQVEECVAARIKNAIFPEPPPGTVAEVDYPFVFGSQN